MKALAAKAKGAKAKAKAEESDEEESVDEEPTTSDKEFIDSDDNLDVKVSGWDDRKEKG